jgi:hypothetical protein
LVGWLIEWVDGMDGVGPSRKNVKQARNCGKGLIANRQMSRARQQQAEPQRSR